LILNGILQSWSWISNESGSHPDLDFVYLFLVKNCNLLTDMSKLQEKPSSLKREHPALKKMRFGFVGHFFPPGGYRSSDPN
jgi:hypothetical protein